MMRFFFWMLLLFIENMQHVSWQIVLELEFFNFRFIYFDLVANFEAFILEYMAFESLGQPNMTSNVILNTRNSIVA